MTLTLELSPDVMERLQAAAERKGSAAPQVVEDLILEHLPPKRLENSNASTLALLEQWRREDASMTDEEVLQERQFWKEFEDSINAERRAAGMREL